MPQLKSKIQKLCGVYGIHPSKMRGQNFLCNEDILRKIVDAGEINSEDIILEVGPGLGNMTALLAARAKKVIAVEIDNKLAEILKAQLVEYKNIDIIHGDVLKSQVSSFKFQDYKVVANLPYNISSYFLRKFLTNAPKPKLMVLLLQREVAERLCALPGKMSLLSFSVQFYARPQKLFDVPKENFWPEPKVDSSAVKIELKKEEEIKDILKRYGTDELSLFRLVKFGFSSRRKQLHKNLASGLGTLLKKKLPSESLKKVFLRLKLNPLARAQELSIEDWLKISREVRKL